MHGSYDDIPYFNPLECLIYYKAITNNRAHRLPERLTISARCASFFADAGSVVHDALVQSSLTSNSAPDASNSATATGKSRTHAQKAKSKKEVPSLPPFYSDHADRSHRLTKPCGKPFVTILSTLTRHACSSELAGHLHGSGSESDGVASSAPYIVARLTISGIRALWTHLLEHMHGVGTPASRKIVLAYADVALAMRPAENGILLSVALAGVASILHFYSSKPGYEDRLNGVSLTVTCLGTTRGLLAGDEIYVFLERRLCLAVQRDGDAGVAGTDGDDGESLLSALLSRDQIVQTSSKQEWLDVLRDLALEAHESLCDAQSDSDDTVGPGLPMSPAASAPCANGPGLRALCLASPVIIVVVPPHDRLRETVVSCLLDVYSSVPVRVTTDLTWSLSDFSDPGTPLFFVCSAHWIYDQDTTPEEERLLSQLKVKRVFHAGCAELGDTTEDEIVSSLTMLRHLTKQSSLQEIVLRNAHMAIDFGVGAASTAAYLRCIDKGRADAAGTGANEVGGHARVYRRDLALPSLLLLICRRFMLRYVAANTQPYVTLSRSLFISSASYDAFAELAVRMHEAGLVVVHPTGTADEITCEYSVLGRFMSSQYKMRGSGSPVMLAARPRVDLFYVDVKAVLWSHAFRQRRDVAYNITRANHVFDDTVQAAVDALCERHNIHLGDSDAMNYVHVQSALNGYLGVVRELSDPETTGVDEFDRVHRLLSVPTGQRTRVSDHHSSREAAGRSTRCRGWYESGPLSDDAPLSVSKAAVPIYCTAPTSLYCEMTGDDVCSALNIQCPLELSFPLLVLRSVLHTHLHNNCVFFESATPSNAVALPLNVLQSSITQTILGSAEGRARNSHAEWIDGCVSDMVSLAPSEETMLAPFAYRGTSYNALCDRGAALQRKRARALREDEERDRKQRQDAEARRTFRGVRPRTRVEEEAIDEFIKLIGTLGRSRAEASFRGKRGFAFLTENHELHDYYLHRLKQSN